MIPFLLALSAAAHEVRCAEVTQMVQINVPSEAVLASLAAPGATRDEDPECAGWLPDGIRERFLALSVTEPTTSIRVEPRPTPVALDPVAVARVRRDQAEAEFRGDALALRAVYELPDPGQATALAGLIGFGAGFYHAEDYGLGAAFTVVDATALGLVGGGAAMMLSWDSDQREKGPALAAVGASVELVSFVVQVATAGPVARRNALRRLEASRGGAD